MSFYQSPSSLHGSPLYTLKEKASVKSDPNTTLSDWFHQAKSVYLAAIEADSLNQIESAYLEYFKASGILQVIIQHPDFKNLKTQQAAIYRIYSDVAPKILDSTQRAKQLAEIIESTFSRHAQSTSSPSNLTVNNSFRDIGGGISSRIKKLQAAGFPSTLHSSTNHDQPSDSLPQSPFSSMPPDRRPLPIPPSQPANGLSAGLPQSNFVSTALEAESNIRSGSAPPNLSQDFQPPTRSDRYNSIGNGRLNPQNPSSHHPPSLDTNLEHTLANLRTPSQFDQAFPKLSDMKLDDPQHSLLDLPSVPKTSPFTSVSDLPPPPRPFQLPPIEHHNSDWSSDLTNLKPDLLVNDTSLGEHLKDDLEFNNHPSHLGPPPPYLDFEHHIKYSPGQSTKSSLTRSHAIKSHLSIQSLRNSLDGSSSPSKKPATSYNAHDVVTSNHPPLLPSDTNEILPAVLSDYFRKSAAAGFETKVLFLDLRERSDFESCRIKSTDVVCIEPLVLLKNGGRGVSSSEIEQSLILSPRKEQALFENRHEFDYVVIYDKRSVQLPVHRSVKDLIYSSDPSEQINRLLLLLYLAIYKEEYVKPLKQPPMLLSGGIEGWIKVAGEAGVVGKGTTSSYQPQQQVSQAQEINSSMNGIPITLRLPPNHQDNLISIDNHDDSSDIKRVRRQVALFGRETSSDQNFIARTIADLTRSGGIANQFPSSSNSMPNLFPNRLPIPSYGSSSYQSNGNISSVITLPQQTLQRPKSSQPYDAHPPPPESASSVYSPPNLLPSSLYPPPPQISTLQPPNNYGVHQSSFSSSRPLDPSYGQFTLNSLRPPIQYPQVNPQSQSKSPQPPPPAVTPAGSSLMPGYFHRLPTHVPVPPQPALINRQSHFTPPITPFSPGRHGPSEAYFNPSFEDGQVGLTGLKNLGNTCYMNSTLQCISATIPLARFFKDGSYKRCINRTNPFGTQGQLAESVAELVRVLWGAQYTFVSPITFREAICKFAPQFRGSDQHDAQEFLGFLLDGLHEDLNLVTNKPLPIEMTPEREAALESLPTQLASAKEWEIYKRRDNSVIVELFQGQYRSRLQCLTCSTTSTTYNTFMYLSLPIPMKRGMSKVSLTQCLDAFLKEEIMEKDDAWNCPKCNARRKATKRLSIARLPPILLIHLKRFSFKGPFSDKLETYVQYPVYGLDLTEYLPPPLITPSNGTNSELNSSTYTGIQKPTVNIYDLYAVCNHFGSLSSGHYTAFIRSQKDWYNIGDSRVSKTDEKSIKARSAYLLCFRRRN
ncbi:hypothetical protein O181_032826 [Austropuccinia psidii MF-1]|uniref:ubiquitinyl hydrolase 1 n=1 Tax=Austropuccinia psidii MF-1 TaxID=1389203 RepID=A0A9Q3CXJ4_9BASI|nr:hypothetical protein [Austropuccinia psidii MF-1]